MKAAGAVSLTSPMSNVLTAQPPHAVLHEELR